MTSKKYIQHRLKILKKAIICLTVIVIVCIIALACYIFYAAYILGKTPAPHYEEMDYAPEYELDDINPRVSNGPQKHIKKRNFDYSIAITDKFIYNDGFAPYLIINATQNEIFTTIHYVKDEHCYYTPDGGWFCDRTIIGSCPAPQITKLQADNLLRTYLSFNAENTSVPLSGKIFSPFDIYVIRKDKYLDASIIHVPKLSVRAKKTTVALIQELQNTVPEIENLFLNCRNKFNF